MARPHDIERAVDLLLARVDQGDKALRLEVAPTNGFAQRFDDWLRARLGRTRSLDYRVAPPLQADARHHRLAGDSARAVKLVIERQQGQEIAPLRLGCEQRREKAVAVGGAHLVEHITVRS